jgi:hypothetical protein
MERPGENVESGFQVLPAVILKERMTPVILMERSD